STELDPGQLAVWVANYQDSVTRIDLLDSPTGGTGAVDETNVVTTFEEAPGWNTVTTTFGPDGEELPVTWAANVPFVSEEDPSGFPSETIRALPADGIVITAVGPRAYTGGETFPAIREPLDLSQGHCEADQYETQPAANVSKCILDTMVGEQLFNVMVWFGKNHPGDEMTAQANEELARLVIAGP
ncbi:MAG TPA: hypothetical protein VGR41_04360, partial [Actinomycetota bacterium]|nr:hypothetical protein [Actinomycetota bacterium]